MKIISVTFNRNGSSPAPSFICAVFKYEEDYPKETFIATWENKEGEDCEVDNETMRITNITRPDASYRADYFSRKLPKAIKEYCEKLKLSEISISAACFPQLHYKEKTAD